MWCTPSDVLCLDFQKVHKFVLSPERAHRSDAGIDVFYCPNFGESYEVCKYKSIMLRQGENHLFETGLKIAVPHGFALIVFNRSGMAAKSNLLRGACIIDPGYAGEIFIDLHNVGRDPAIVRPGQKIAQLLLIPVVHFAVKELTEDVKLYANTYVESDRGTDCLGSTDTDEKQPKEQKVEPSEHLTSHQEYTEEELKKMLELVNSKEGNSNKN
jgi:dUTP pyrophosphatase